MTDLLRHVSIDQLINITDHNRSSCTDEEPINHYSTEARNGTPRCVRCALLKVAEGWTFPDEYEVDVTVEFKWVKPERKVLRPHFSPAELAMSPHLADLNGLCNMCGAGWVMVEQEHVNTTFEITHDEQCPHIKEER